MGLFPSRLEQYRHGLAQVKDWKVGLVIKVGNEPLLMVYNIDEGTQADPIIETELDGTKYYIYQAGTKIVTLRPLLAGKIGGSCTDEMADLIDKVSRPNFSR